MSIQIERVTLEESQGMSGLRYAAGNRIEGMTFIAIDPMNGGRIDGGIQSIVNQSVHPSIITFRIRSRDKHPRGRHKVTLAFQSL